jgi:hypothetical protein
MEEMEVFEGETVAGTGENAPAPCCLSCGCSGSLGYNQMNAQWNAGNW